MTPGCEIKDLPDVLQHWVHGDIYSGNPILQKIDPVDWVIKNPWSDLKFGVAVLLAP